MNAAAHGKAVGPASRIPRNRAIRHVQRGLVVNRTPAGVRHVAADRGVPQIQGAVGNFDPAAGAKETAACYLPRQISSDRAIDDGAGSEVADGAAASSRFVTGKRAATDCEVDSGRDNGATAFAREVIRERAA